jgi:DNA helicase-2/ATP-dependent DNA helicase PcrA
MSSYDLNPQQLQAVQQTEGPVMVVAGAGSGKTRVITCRIAHLIREKNEVPDGILAITFTNKAAREMQERVHALIGKLDSPPWISTFHSFCLRVLRRDIHHLGLSTEFVIYDAQDQLALVRQSMKLAGINEDAFSPKTMLGQISAFKNDLLGPGDIDRDALNYGNKLKAAELYPVYQEQLRQNNGVDFDDLLGLTVRLLRDAEVAADYYSKKFRYILVDEFQDTNLAQFSLVRLLARGHNNVCVVGDDDQSIYRWRGANVENILNFDREFPGTTVIKLEENYRSTQTILKAAGAVVRENAARKEKTLWTRNETGAPIIYYRAEDEIDEARAVCERVSRYNREEAISFSDMAVLYRTNAQSRVLEEELRRLNVPYQVLGGLKFYERKEVKDILAYMRAVFNPADSVSLRRIINVPARGIGKTSLDQVSDFSVRAGIPLLEGLRRAESERVVSSGTGRKIAQFIALLEEFDGVRRSSTVLDFLDRILERTGYAAMLEKEGSKESMKEGRARMENLRELYSAVEQFVERDARGGLQEFLDSTALVAEQDRMDDARGLLPLMTMHTCKGLEFDAVFIVGMENGLLPHASSLSETEELEEERRLCYVGFTRARKRLFLSNAKRRRLYGEQYAHPPSDFLSAIPPEVLKREPEHMAPEVMRRATAIHSSDPYSAPAPTAFLERGSSGEYAVGTKVVHPKFGRGVVVNREGAEDDLKVVVFFKAAGKKTLAVNQARLIVL